MLCAASTDNRRFRLLCIHTEQMSGAPDTTGPLFPAPTGNRPSKYIYNAIFYIFNRFLIVFPSNNVENVYNDTFFIILQVFIDCKGSFLFFAHIFYLFFVHVCVKKTTIQTDVLSPKTSCNLHKNSHRMAEKTATMLKMQKEIFTAVRL